MKHFAFVYLFAICLPALRLSTVHRASVLVVLIEWARAGSQPLPLMSPDTAVMVGIGSIWGINFLILATMLGHLPTSKPGR